MMELNVIEPAALAEIVPLIFIVADDDAVRSALGLLVRTCGWDVRALSCREELQSSLVQVKPACIVLDLQWHDRGGNRVLRELVRLAPDTPVIAITEFDDWPLAQQALRGGASDVLAKPLRADALVQAISRALSSPSPTSLSGVT